jgi:hypothetical protein
MATAYQHASYSLADYILTIGIDSASLQQKLGLSENKISIGGEGQFLGSVKVALETPQWSTKADSTGAWVHSKSYDQHGTFELEINQMAPAVIRFIGIVSCYYSDTEVKDGFTLTLKKAGNNETFNVMGEDCRIVRIADQSFGNEADNQTWTFTAGRITFSVPSK